MAIHIAESRWEADLVEQGTGPFADGLRRRDIAVAPRAASPIQLLDRLGVLDDAKPLLIHCVRLKEGDVAAIALAGCGVAHCPASNAKLGHGIAPLLDLLEANVAVGLGSDSVASNNRMSILEEARLAALFQGARLARVDAVPPRQALELATLGGARAIGVEDRVGSLEVGKAADLAAFDLRCARAAPLHDPEAAAVHALSGCDAVFVAVAGRVLVERGHVVGEDAAVQARVQDSADRLTAWLEEMGAAGARPPSSATR